MSRISRAAKTLEAEVRTLRPDAEVEAIGEPDGFGVIRTLKFDEETAKVIHPLLVELADTRVSDFHLTEAGYLHVSLTGALGRGEDRSPFNLAAAQTVLGAADGPDAPVVEEVRTSVTAKKATAKRSATKRAAAKKSAG